MIQSIVVNGAKQNEDVLITFSPFHPVGETISNAAISVITCFFKYSDYTFFLSCNTMKRHWCKYNGLILKKKEASTFCSLPDYSVHNPCCYILFVHMFMARSQTSQLVNTRELGLQKTPTGAGNVFAIFYRFIITTAHLYQ